MNASLALAAQTALRAATARQLYVLGTDAPLSEIDHQLVARVHQTEEAFLAAGGTEADYADILSAADQAASAQLDR